MEVFMDAWSMPSTPEVKQTEVRRHGGRHVKIMLHGDCYDETAAAAHDLGCRPCLAAGTGRLIQALPQKCKTRNHFFLHAGFSCWEKQVK